MAFLILELTRANGLSHAEIHLNRAMLTLPGYFRPTKVWDILIVHKQELVAAIQLKSHVGPSFGNNFNNRTEEAIGAALIYGMRIARRLLASNPALLLAGSC